MNEPVLCSMVGIATDVVTAMGASGWLDDGVPIALFGHSMGARVVFEMARLLEQQGGTEGNMLLSILVSGAPPNHLSRSRAEISHLPRDELVDVLRKMGGTVRGRVRVERGRGSERGAVAGASQYAPHPLRALCGGGYR